MDRSRHVNGASGLPFRPARSTQRSSRNSPVLPCYYYNTTSMNAIPVRLYAGTRSSTCWLHNSAPDEILPSHWISARAHAHATAGRRGHADPDLDNGVDPPIYRDFNSLGFYLIVPICIHLYLFRIYLLLLFSCEITALV